LGILNNIKALLKGKTKEAQEIYHSHDKAPAKTCFNCGTTEHVKYKGGQQICKRCLKKARRLAKRLV